MEETLRSIYCRQKQTLHPENQASKGLNTIYWFFKIVFVYLLIAAGVIIFLISLFQEDTLVKIGILYSLYLIFVGFINLLLLQFIKSLIVRTKAAEYYIAEIESKYEIK